MEEWGRDVIRGKEREREGKRGREIPSFWNVRKSKEKKQTM